MSENTKGSGLKDVTAYVFSRMIGCSRGFIYKLAREGRIPYHRFGGLIRFDRADVENFIHRSRRD